MKNDESTRRQRPPTTSPQPGDNPEQSRRAGPNRNGDHHGPMAPGTAPPPWRTTRVTKTMWPPNAGTVQFAALHGHELVCVRYRQDSHGLYRYTTLELVVDAAPLTSTKARTQRLQVAIAYQEVELRAQARKLGAKWLPEQRTWELSGRAVQELNLACRINRPRRK